MNGTEVHRYEVSGIKLRTDYSFVLRSIHDRIDDVWEDELFGRRKKTRVFMKYNPQTGILTFAVRKKVDIFELGAELARGGLTLKVLK